MIHYKTEKELELIRQGGKKLKRVVEKLRPHIKVGVTTNEIDTVAIRFIQEEGAKPSFQTVKGYRWATCLPVNEQVVHTPPSDRVLGEGDLVTLDIGLLYQGFHTDYAETILLGSKDTKKVKFLAAGEKALEEAISQAKAGKRLGDISQAIHKRIRGEGYHILRELTGHGIGRELHEDPFVVGYTSGPREKTLLLKAGLVLAVEVIYSEGTEEIAYEDGNDWSITSADKSLTACFEHTIIIGRNGTSVVT